MKKRITILISLCLITIKLNAQISVSKKIEVKKEMIAPEPYLANTNLNSDILYDDVEDKRYYGLDCFFAPKEVLDDQFVSPIYLKKPENDSFGFEKIITIDSIVNKQYYIKKVVSSKDFNTISKKRIYGKKSQSKRSGSHEYEPFVVLEQIDNEDFVIYVGQNFATKFLILKPFFETLQSEYLNKEMIALNKYNDKVKIIETDEKIVIPNNSSWQVTEISFFKVTDVPIGYNLIFRLQNKSFGTINHILNISDQNILKSKWNKIDFITKENYLINVKKQKTLIAKRKIEQEQNRIEYEKTKKENIKKYGSYFGNLINNRKIEIGMTKEMCIKSWGYPLRKKAIKDSSSLREIFVYSRNNIVIFKNNKIIEFEY